MFREPKDQFDLISLLLRRSLSAFCVFTVELSRLAGQVAPGTQSLEASSNNLCGVHCLYLAMKSLGDDSIALDALKAEFCEPSAGGYSMEQIRQIANAHGLQTLAVSTTLENLNPLWPVCDRAKPARPQVSVRHGVR